MTIREFGAVTIKDLFRNQNVALSIIIGGYATLNPNNVGSIMDVSIDGYSPSIAADRTKGIIDNDLYKYGSLLTCVLGDAEVERPERMTGLTDGYALRNEYLVRFPWYRFKTDHRNNPTWPVFVVESGAAAKRKTKISCGQQRPAPEASETKSYWKWPHYCHPSHTRKASSFVPSK
jgi:hypothetical protein